MSDKQCPSCGEDPSTHAEEFEAYGNCSEEHVCKGWLPPDEVARRIQEARDKVLGLCGQWLVDWRAGRLVTIQSLEADIRKLKLGEQ